MKKRSNNLTRTALFVTLMLTLFCSASPILAAPARVAILPFDINADKDMSFLQEGILDMLGSRLAWRDKVEVINKSETKSAVSSVEGFDGESRALLVGGKLQADYVLFGSLTVFGESVSIDAKMVDVGGQQAPLPFFAQTRSMGEVIPQINQFATTINATVFGRGVVQRPVVAPEPQAGTVPAATGVQPAPQAHDPRMHPEKLLQSGIQSETRGPVTGQANQTPNPAFVPAATPYAGQEGGTHWKSRSFKALITGLAVADVDNDGRMELVVVTDRMVSIYRMENGRLVKTAEVEQTRQNTFISVDAADINGNGTPEIYVSSLGSGRTVVDSFVLEYSGGAYQTISDGNNWYYRVSKTVDQGSVLLGQRQRLGAESIFKEPIHEMSWQGDRLTPGRQVLPGGKANLMGVAYDDITHNGGNVVAAYSDWDRVRIYAGGETIWEDGDRTGGDKVFFNLPKTDAGQPNRQYFPLRIQTADIDRDGKAEVLIARHEDLARSMLKDFRLFRKATIGSTLWNGLSLVPEWETQSLSGRISDFTIGDIDHDGVDELVIALVSKEGSIMFTDSVSKVVTFDLNPK